MPNTQKDEAAQRTSLRDPEQLNQAIRLTSRSTWILLAGISLCAAGVIAWGFLGRLDFHAQGQGILMRDASEVANVVARDGGTLAALHVRPGVRVTAGDVVASVKLDEVTAQLQQAMIALDAQRAELASRKVAAARDIARRKADLDAALASLKANIADANKNRQMLQQLYDSYEDELAKGLTTRPQVQAAFDRLNGVVVSIRQMTDQLSSLQTQQIEFENKVATDISDLTMRVIAAESQVKNLQVRHDIGSSIRSPVAGTVTEVTAQVNSTVTAGTKLLVIESGNARQDLIVHAYLPIDQGKRVSKGMPVEVTPSSIDSSIYGSIRGKVLGVSTLPMSREGLLAVIGNPALASQMMATGAPIEVRIALDKDATSADGLSWTSSVSPHTPITPGTTAMTRIVVDRVMPASLIIPIVKTWTRP